jgi:hypothetical protein
VRAPSGGRGRRTIVGQDDLGDSVALALAQDGLLSLAADLEVDGGMSEHAS